MTRGTLTKAKDGKAKLNVGVLNSTVNIRDLPEDVKTALESASTVEVLTDMRGAFSLANREKGHIEGLGRPLPTPSRGEQTYRVVGKDRSGRLLFEPPRPRGLVPQGTDAFLSSIAGTEYSSKIPYFKVVKFASDDRISAIQSQEPDVDRNPYNFVAFPSTEPWEDMADHPGHDRWFSNLHSGILKFKFTATTPIFVPGGFPFRAQTNEFRAAQRTILRHFCRMKKTDHELHYAIPGSSFKGVLRAEVEAIANSRLGEVNQEVYGKRLPYRRRAFRLGMIIAVNKTGLDVKEVEETDNIAGRAATLHANLFARSTADHSDKQIYVKTVGPTFQIDDVLIRKYTSNIDHPHFERHYNSHRDAYGLESISLENVRNELKAVGLNDLIYFTANGNKVTSFGKNVNYLWPAEWTVKQLVDKFYPRGDANKLNGPLGIAERLFGFTSPHDRQKGTHPFRGKLRFETLWGEPVREESATEKLELAPLTSPATPLKARPLYLAPAAGVTGGSASYDDSVKPKLNGRKFYWHQKTVNNSVAGFHRKQKEHESVKSQLPPTLIALKAGAEFTGRIHFDNLLEEELGCIITVLEGKSADSNHGLKLGMGKPRGLGTVICTELTVERIDTKSRYQSLFESSSAEPLKANEIASLKEAFCSWCRRHASRGQSDAGYIDDWTRLHTVPTGESVRYYPVNFCDYNWMPGDNSTTGEPKAPNRRPRAMKPARKNRD